MLAEILEHFDHTGEKQLLYVTLTGRIDCQAQVLQWRISQNRSALEQHFGTCVAVERKDIFAVARFA